MFRRYFKTYNKLIIAATSLVIVILLASTCYWLVSGREYSFFDSFYMTIITISTIGYGEIIDLTNNPAGRALTILIALTGIGILTYILTNVTAIIVEGQLTDSLRRSRMENKAKKLKGHYIICGLGGVGNHIVNELCSTKRPLVMVDTNMTNIEKVLEDHPEVIFIEGDATDNSTLMKAGIDRAQGVFATTDDDNQNLVISLSARQLNSSIRIVARCTDIKNQDKLKKAGANSVISPTYIGGLRMASEMVRPTVVSFLDIMLRESSEQLRVEEIRVPDCHTGKDLSALDLKKFRSILLLAIKSEGKWIYNPPENHIVKSNDTLVIMTNPEAMSSLAESWKI
jgi:voltage-gated potassium channel